MKLALAGLVVLGLALFVASASRVGEPEGCLSGCARSEPRRPGPLRVLSLNVLHGFPHFGTLEARLGLVAAEILEDDADLVLLQEVPWTPGLGNGAAHLAALVGQNHVFMAANGNRRTIFFEEGAAILSRFPLGEVAGFELEPRAGLFEQRIVLHARVAAPGGPIDAFSTHLTNGAAERNRGQADSLRRWVDRRAGARFVVAGDFNALPDSPQMRRLASDWTDAWSAARSGEAGETCCAALAAGPGAPLRERIDFLFTAPGARVRTARRVLAEPVAHGGAWLRASDHAGLFVELAL